MNTTRRDFVRLATVAGLGLSPLAKLAARPPRPPHAAKTLLILGGTSFLGPACTEAAIAKGYKVTHFNRGRIESMRKDRGRPSAVPDGVEILYGNRDPEKTADADWKKEEERDANSPKGLSQLAGKKWDAVIDTSGYFPRMVKASAELLAPNVKQYIFISTISVYKDNSTPGMKEDAELNTLKNPKTEEFDSDPTNYGGGKAMCEAAAEAAMPGRVANIRPGYIVGPRDTSQRFIYWPLRVRRGGEVLIPGKPTDPIQIIDVRDLAEWCIHCIDNNINGVFNATGPAKELAFKDMLEGCKQGVGGEKATYEWADPDFIKKQGTDPGEFRLWASPEGESAGFHRISIAAAIKNGLKFRPLPDTAKATLAWFDSLPADIQKSGTDKLITAEKERNLLELWLKQKG